jgi:hypothetical protein
MLTVRWLLVLAILVCGGAAGARLSPAGLTIVVVRGDARDVVLIDPQGRVDRSDPRAGETPIPKCTRWDGGTETTLDDSVGNGSTGDVVTQIELAEPIVGRYRLYAGVGAEGSANVTVTRVTVAGSKTCPDLKQGAPAAKGRYIWTIEFLRGEGAATCPIRLSRAALNRPRK